jgi:hypothetical protein
MVKWAIETNNGGGNIKKANQSFAPMFNALPVSFKERIAEHAFEEAIRLFEATHSINLADSVWDFL